MLVGNDVIVISDFWIWRNWDHIGMGVVDMMHDTCHTSYDIQGFADYAPRIGCFLTSYADDLIIHRVARRKV